MLLLLALPRVRGWYLGSISDPIVTRQCLPRRRHHPIV